MAAPFLDELLEIANSISCGEIPEYQHNECFTSGSFDLLLINLRSSKAYDVLVKLCEKYETIKASSPGLKGYCSLLSSLAPLTNTTEMPSGIDIIINENKEFTNELQKWYRI